MSALPAEFAAQADAFIAETNAKAETIATRKASQNTLQAFGPLLPELLGGSADLAGSNLTLWKGCEAWWARYPLICWFQLDEGEDGVKGRLRLFAEVGPLADANCRAKLIAGIRKSAEKSNIGEIQFRADADRPGARYSKFLKPTGNTVQIADVSDSEAIEQGMKRLLKKFAPTFTAVSEALPKFMKYVEDRNE